jgi:predicted CXXCH cytochrome family protein
MAPVKRSLSVAALAAGLLLAGAWQTTARAADKCFDCHSSRGDAASRLYKADIHHDKGVTCAACHGGDPTSADKAKAMDKSAGFVGVQKDDDISARCASCHASEKAMRDKGSQLPVNQYAGLQSSVHGKPSVTGKGRIAQCTTCHGAHGVLSASNPKSPVNHKNVLDLCASCHSNAGLIRTYNPTLPIDQFDKYKTSVHGQKFAQGDQKVAVCSNCHGSHEILSSKDVRSRTYPTNIPGTCKTCHGDPEYMKPYGIPTDQYEKFAGSVHGIALLKKNDVAAPACNSCHGNHGATPPGIESISNVCGTCHALNADLFAKSPHKAAFDAAQIPECESCHGNHGIQPPTDAMLGTDSAAVCVRCHSADDGSKGWETASAMRSMMDSLSQFENAATVKVAEAEQKGMEIQEAKFKLRDARQFRMQSRTMFHSLDNAQFREVALKSLLVSVEVRHEAENVIGEFFFRRMGLGVSTLIMTVLAISLYFFIRRMEGRNK